MAHTAEPQLTVPAAASVEQYGVLEHPWRRLAGSNQITGGKVFKLENELA